MSPINSALLFWLQSCFYKRRRDTEEHGRISNCILNFLKKAFIIMVKQEHFEVIVKPIEDAVLAPRNRMKLSK